MGKIAMVLGATGLVGKALVEQLLSDSEFSEVRVFVRKSTEIHDPKLSEIFIDFDAPDKWKNLVFGDVLFSAFGTTLKKAGSKKNQYKIDYTYQFQMAKAAAQNNVKSYVLVSAAGASDKSSLFYSRMKGELDRAVQHLGFHSVSLIKPSVLEGLRTDARMGERVAIAVGNLFIRVPIIKKYRPIKDTIVAKAMVNAYKSSKNTSLNIYELEDVFKLAGSQ